MFMANYDEFYLNRNPYDTNWTFILHSDNGFDFTLVDTIPLEIQNIYYSEGLYVACIGDYYNLYKGVYTSRDLKKWDKISIDSGFSNYVMASSNETLIIVSNWGEIYSTTDGTNWHEAKRKLL